MADMFADPADLASLQQFAVADLHLDAAKLLIEIGTAIVQSHTGQRIVLVEDDDEVIDLDEYDGGTWLRLRQRPVVSVGVVKIGSTVVTDFTASLSRGRLWRHCGWRSQLVRWYSQPSTVTVRYSHGYAPGDQKLQLARGAVLGMIGGLYANPSGASSVRIDDFAATYAAMERQLLTSEPLMALLRKQYSIRSPSARLVKG